MLTQFKIKRKTVFVTGTAKYHYFLKKGYRLVSMAYWVGNINSASYKLEKVA